MDSYLVQSRGAGGAALPALPQTAGIVARWSADDITPQSDNTNLVTWTDSVGAAAATNATGARQPKYRTNVLGGKPAVQFSGGQVLDCGRPTALMAAMDTPSSRTVLVVYKTLGATSNGMPVSAANGGGAGYMLVADQTNVGIFNANAPDPGARFMTLCHTGQVAGGVVAAYRTAVNGGIVHIGVVAANTSAGNTFSIGGINLNNSFFVNAYIFDVVVWNVGLTPAELFQADNWACAKYGQATVRAGLTKLYVFDGDSETAGAGSASGAGAVAGTYPYKVAATMGLIYGQWTNTAIGGITAAQMLTKAPSDLSGLVTTVGLPLRVAAWEYYNQKAQTPAFILTAAQNYVAYVKALANTKVLWASSTGSSSDPDSTRSTYNTSLDATGASFADAYCALHTDTNIGDQSSYATNHVAYWFDVIHKNAAGNTFIAADVATPLIAMG